MKLGDARWNRNSNVYSKNLYTLVMKTLWWTMEFCTWYIILRYTSYRSGLETELYIADYFIKTMYRDVMIVIGIG